jgi:hypothetical protein
MMVRTIQHLHFFIHSLFEARTEFLFIFGRIEDNKISFGDFLTFNNNTELKATLEPLLQNDNSSDETNQGVA